MRIDPAHAAPECSAFGLKREMAAVPKFYNAWFCPFAQRAWIALLEKGVQFEYVEQYPYNKSPEWLAVNPRGLVPVIVHNGKSVYESAVCIEYIDEAWKTNVNLLPVDPYERAHARILSDLIGKKIVPDFYKILLKKEEAERSKAKVNMTEAVKQLFSDFDSSTPFFGGKTLNLVDIMLAPFAYRMYVILQHYRNFNIPNDCEQLQKFHSWCEALFKYDSFKKTVPDEGDLIKEYKQYADDTANSEVAVAIRKGVGLP